jgi:hypothetical protein
LGIGDWAQSPIPNPQSPIPNPQSPSNNIFLKNYFKIIIFYKKKELNLPKNNNKILLKPLENIFV